MGRIIAIGGGEIRLRSTIDIDREVVKSSGKKNPKLLFIPTASGEPEGYINTIKTVYGEELGCHVETLHLIDSKPVKERIRDTILNSDIIYVGGGNTKLMMNVWRELDVDKVLEEAYNKGIILSGLSAGSICWFENGHSDSDTYSTGEKRPYSKVKGIGLIPLLHCPHYNEDDREDKFDDMVFSLDENGLAINNNCAIDILDDKFRIIRSDETGKAFHLFKSGEKLIKSELTNINEYKHIDELLKPDI